MKENAKKFLRAASTDVAIRQELKEAKDIETILKTAKAHGFDLTAEDFTNAGMEEISEDEMKAVAGGYSCACEFSNGLGNQNGMDCACPFDGYGFGRSGECWCSRGGRGDTNLTAGQIEW